MSSTGQFSTSTKPTKPWCRTQVPIRAFSAASAVLHTLPRASTMPTPCSILATAIAVVAKSFQRSFVMSSIASLIEIVEFMVARQ